MEGDKKLHTVVLMVNSLSVSTFEDLFYGTCFLNGVCERPGCPETVAVSLKWVSRHGIELSAAL